MIIEIDPGISETKYVIGENNRGVIEIGIIRTDDGDGIPLIRYQRILKEIQEKIKKYKIQKIFIRNATRKNDEDQKVIEYLESLIDIEFINNREDNFNFIWQYL